MRDFSLAYPDFKDGFSMLQQPAATFQDANNQSDTILQQPAAKLTGTTYVLHPAANIPWTQNQVVLDKVKTTEERFFYLVKCAQNGWSRNVLAVQIETTLQNILAPLGVAEYKLSTRLPKTLKNEIPSEKELGQALQEDNPK